MNNEKLNNHIRDWTSHELNWDEDKVVWTAAHDGGELIEYFTLLLKKMNRAEREILASRDTNE